MMLLVLVCLCYQWLLVQGLKYPVDVKTGTIQSASNGQYVVYGNFDGHCRGETFLLSSNDKYLIVGQLPSRIQGKRVGTCNFQIQTTSDLMIRTDFLARKCSSWPSCYQVEVRNGGQSQISLPSLSTLSSGSNCSGHSYLYSESTLISIDNCAMKNDDFSLTGFNFTISLETANKVSNENKSTAKFLQEYLALAFVPVLIFIGIFLLFRTLCTSCCAVCSNGTCLNSCRTLANQRIPRETPALQRNEIAMITRPTGNNSFDPNQLHVSGPPGIRDDSLPSYQDFLAFTKGLPTEESKL